MKKGSSIVNLILDTTDDKKIIIARLIVGLIFISEGIQQFLIVSMVGPELFKQAGFDNPMFWADFTGVFEILCGLLIVLGLLTRLASVPLLIIMITAFITTKLPLLAHENFWAFAHEYNIDFALTMLLILLLISGGGNWSADLKMHRASNA